ncbi:TPA: hypothetical protein ACU2YK_002661 [Staphylococcus aureus]
MNHVEKRREVNIQKACDNNDWQTLLRLLNQPIENAQRKDRFHHVFSLNHTKVCSNDHHSEFGDLVSSPSLTPLEHLLLKERQSQVNKALSLLNKIDCDIITGFYLDNKSYSQLSKDVGISDKTVKKRVIQNTNFLKSYLQDYI